MEKNNIKEEYQEKVGTIRNYWDKILMGNEEGPQNGDDQQNESKCKIVEVKTKIDEVIKKFQQPEEMNKKSHQSKVQLGKQMFEKSTKNQKNEKFSSYIRECREIFENSPLKKRISSKTQTPTSWKSLKTKTIWKRRRLRVEKDACLNNLKLNPGNLTATQPAKDINPAYKVEGRENRSAEQPVQRGRNKLLQGSLENVSVRPLGEFLDQEESTLRRSRSLALIREDTFNSLEIPAGAGQQRRSQLIPRAKLIDRTCLKDNRFLPKGRSQESIYIDPHISKRRTLSKTDVRETPCKEFSLPNCSEIDSYGPKSIDTSSLYHGTEQNLSYSEIGLSLPSYYHSANTKSAESDISTTVSEEKIERSFDKKHETKLSRKESLDSIQYDENIVLSKNTPLYDSIGDYYTKSFKPKTIRGNPLVYNNLESKPSAYDSDSTISECLNQNITEYIESDTNFDEIKLTNENIKLVHEDKITKNVIYDSESSNVENNPIYDEITNTSHVKEIDKSQSVPDVTINSLTWTKKRKEPPIKTFVKVPPPEDIRDDTTTSSEEYKTIVSIETDDKLSSCFSSTNSIHEAKKHSHNYLKEFLESQRGSRKPLQNFLSKRISRVISFGNQKPNLTENQYHSLPDISASKILRKSEKIDWKLRKSDQKSPKIQQKFQHYNKKTQEAPEQKTTKDTTTNRFIVNIGRHFDVTAQSNVPVDFEVKISKISKSKQTKEKKKTTEEDREKTFLDAVRTLKETLGTTDENQNITKPEIVAVKTKHGINEEITKLSKRRVENQLKSTKQEENNKVMEKNNVKEEYQEKVGTIRNYWDKILMGNEDGPQNGDDQQNESKCKIVEVKTKIDEVKKKFEQPEETNKKSHQSKVQLAKQMFEKPTKNDKNEKFSSYIRECREIFENPYFEKESQFESLNPNIVEIVENQNKLEEKKADSAKSGNHKPVFKSRSVIDEPEFDHVRYRILKSDVFQKKIYANCEKESEIEGLMQYLQDFSFHELLIDNNIVIIEPIRTNVKFESKKPKTSRNVTPLIHTNTKSEENDKNSLKRRFFYHPIRVNREVNDNELPNPDTVKQVRQLFEAGLIRSHSTKELDGGHSCKADSDKDRCSSTETNSSASVLSDYGSNENLFESIEDLYYDTQYVSEDILEKIRDHGTSITYYGGRILNKYNGKSDSLTKAIMDEIRRNQKHDDCDCKKRPSHKTVTFIENIENKDPPYQGIKFRLLKSNSCSSRLELVGTKNFAENRNRCKDKNMNDKNLNVKNVNEWKDSESIEDFDKGNFTENTTITLKNNYSTKLDRLSPPQKDGINGDSKGNGDMPKKEINGDIKLPTQTMVNSTNLQFDYNLRDIRQAPKSDMEFEPYEVADN